MDLYYRLQSIPNFLSVFLTPVIGISVDWFGRRTALLTCSAVLLIVAHTLIYEQKSGPVFRLILIGMAFRWVILISFIVFFNTLNFVEAELA